MNILEFMTKLVDSLAWPLALLIALYLVRGNLAGLFPRLREFEYKGFKLKLDEAKQDFSEKEKIVADETPSVLEQLAELSPESAIVKSWMEIEGVTSELIIKELEKTPGAMASMSPLKRGDYLYKQGLIDKSQFKSYHKLRDLRNQAVYLTDKEIQSSDALEYISLASALIEQIKQNET